MFRYAFSLLLIGWTVNVYAQSESIELKVRIERIENGLLEPVTVQGAPIRTMRLVDRMHAFNVPGVSIAVINAGKVEWVRSYGVADVRTGRPLTPSTIFQVASLSKPVTALMTMRLAADGKIDLDEDVNRRLRQWYLPSAQQIVTARELLSHTAGMPEFGLLGYGSDEQKPTLLQVLKGSSPATNPPVVVRNSVGSSYTYSSLGYVALQQYISDATGRPFNILASEKIFEPLSMRDSLYAQSLPLDLVARTAFGHNLDGTVVAGNWREYPELAAAGLWSTAHDLARFVVAVQQAVSGQDTQLVTQQQAKMMLTPVRDSYGLGFDLDHTGAEPVFHHSGSNAGYKSLLFGYERTGKGLVILTNSDYGGTLIDEIARSIAAEYAWDDYHPIERVSVKPKPTLFSRFSGDFAVSNTTLHISHESGHLYIAGPPIGPKPVELISTGDYDYFIREKDVTLHFDSNGSDKIQTLTFIDDRSRKGTRIARSATHVN